MLNLSFSVTRRKSILTFLAVGCVCAVGLALKPADSPATNMQTFAVSWLDSLSKEQQAIAQIPYDSPERLGWHFIPKPERKGVPLRDMNDAQQASALRLVRAALSEMGYNKAQQIMSLEGVLRQLEGPGSEQRRDPRKYYVTISGDPRKTDADTPWGLSFEGHHLSLNFVCRGDQIVDSTPQFFATNPAELKTEVKGPIRKGTRVLAAEEELAFQLYLSLDEAQQKSALIAEEALKEIRFAGEPQAEVSAPEGIAFGKLNPDQAKLLVNLVDVYRNAVPAPVAEKRQALINQSGWDKVHFAWAGASKPGIGHYYRITGPTFLIEFVNTQPDASGNPANHIHCVWRDLTGDFDLPIK
ncbi:DUF3500 domain-containing protein [Roseimaritima multifibrata]|nr:DUF3500 domain-containing protein [Roseimaritima multifibrata]